jgi:hypothetical protein
MVLHYTYSRMSCPMSPPRCAVRSQRRSRRSPHSFAHRRTHP